MVRAEFLERRATFAGAGVLFRDSLEFERALSEFRVEHVTAKPPGDQDLAVLRRR